MSAGRLLALSGAALLAVGLIGAGAFLWRTSQARYQVGRVLVDLGEVPGTDQQWRQTIVDRRLGSLGDEATPYLLWAATRGDRNERYRALFSLARLKSPGAVEGLVAILIGGETVKVRADAAEALGRARDPKSLPPLMRTLQDPQVFEASAEWTWLGALSRITGDDPLVDFRSRLHPAFTRAKVVYPDGRVEYLGPEPPPRPDPREAARIWKRWLVEKGYVAHEEDLRPIYREGIAEDEYRYFEEGGQKGRKLHPEEVPRIEMREVKPASYPLRHALFSTAFLLAGALILLTASLWNRLPGWFAHVRWSRLKVAAPQWWRTVGLWRRVTLCLALVVLLGALFHDALIRTISPRLAVHVAWCDRPMWGEGDWVDPWGNPWAGLDPEADSTLYSFGPNGINEWKEGDDIVWASNGSGEQLHWLAPWLTLAPGALFVLAGFLAWVAVAPRWAPVVSTTGRGWLLIQTIVLAAPATALLVGLLHWLESRESYLPELLEGLRSLLGSQDGPLILSNRPALYGSVLLACFLFALLVRLRASGGASAPAAQECF